MKPARRREKQLSALGRQANILNTEDKYVLFESFNLTYFNYCPVVWHCCNISDMKKIENYSSSYREFKVFI